MKLLQSISVGLVAAVMAGTASAQTIIHVAGSTAFRAPASSAIIDYLATTNNPNSGAVYASYYLDVAPVSSPSTSLGSDAAVYANGTLGTGGTATIVVETYWTGSLAGLVDLVAGSQTSRYIDITNTTVQSTTNADPVNTSSYKFTGTYNGTAGTAGFLGFDPAGSTNVATVNASPDFIFSDSYQNTISKVLLGATLTNPIGGGAKSGGGNYPTFTSLTGTSGLGAAVAGSTVVNAGGTNANTGAAAGGFVGIVPFEWVVGKGSPSSVTNMPQQTANALISGGFVPQSYMTGSPSDLTNYFYLVGRNEDSGTRIGAFAESQAGVAKSPDQYQVPGASDNANSDTTVELFPKAALNTEPNITWATLGHSGYPTGQDVQGALDIQEPTTAAFSSGSAGNSGSNYFIAYLGVGDTNNAVSGGAIKLTYNGVPYSVGAVENGSYTFWTYEHCYRLSSLSGTALSVANFVADDIYNTNADVGSGGTHAEAGASGYQSTSAGGILDNPSSPVQVYRSLSEGGPVNNYSAN